MTKRKMLSVVLVIVLAASGSVAGAELTHPNEIGLYTSSDGTGDIGVFAIGEPVELFLVLTRPTDVLNGGIACTTYSGFQLRMSFDPLPAGELILLGISLPGEHLDIGLKDFDAGYLEFVCGLAIPLPVVDEAIAVGALTFLNQGTQVSNVYLGPSSGGFPRPTEMSFVGGHDSNPEVMVDMYSVGGGHGSAVFQFNGTAVGVETESFGSVKALFR